MPFPIVDLTGIFVSYNRSVMIWKRELLAKSESLLSHGAGAVTVC